MSFNLQELEMAQIGDRLFSRKNVVFASLHEGMTVVVKTYADGAIDGARKEYSVLERCRERSVPAPAPLGVIEATIVMEYLEGPTLSGLLDSFWLGEEKVQPSDQSVLDQAASSLGDWLARFHSAFDCRMCRGDANMRNFMMTSGGVAGIDFEESGSSDIIDDLGQACSSILSMHPMFTRQKIEFCRRVAAAYSSAMGTSVPAELSEATARALEHYARYRSDGELLIKGAAGIRDTGIWSGEER